MVTPGINELFFYTWTDHPAQTFTTHAATIHTYPEHAALIQETVGLALTLRQDLFEKPIRLVIVPQTENFPPKAAYSYWKETIYINTATLITHQALDQMHLLGWILNLLQHHAFTTLGDHLDRAVLERKIPAGILGPDDYVLHYTSRKNIKDFGDLMSEYLAETTRLIGQLNLPSRCSRSQLNEYTKDAAWAIRSLRNILTRLPQVAPRVYTEVSPLNTFTLLRKNMKLLAQLVRDVKATPL